MKQFKIEAPFEPTGDQPSAIAQLTQLIQAGNPMQTLLGATGTGKTHTVARVIEKIGKPTLVLAHNKTLAAQLCNELRQFFPHNAVEYFIRITINQRLIFPSAIPILRNLLRLTMRLICCVTPLRDRCLNVRM